MDFSRKVCCILNSQALSVFVCVENEFIKIYQNVSQTNFS